MNHIIDKRNFYLMLSMYLGRDLANEHGFTRTSNDVKEKEQEWVSNQWEMLFDLGIFNEVVESVEWFSEVLTGGMVEDADDIPQAEVLVEQTKTIILAYGIALVQKLLMNEKIALLGEVVVE